MRKPCLQYFIGLTEYTQVAPFDPSMMTRFRQRLTTQMMQDVNDVIIDRKTTEQIIAEIEKQKDEDTDHSRDESHDEHDSKSGGDKETTSGHEADGDQEANDAVKEAANEGTLILDATCAPQAIRFPTDTSLLSEARQNTEEIIDALHVAGLTDGKKPRTYRQIAKRQYNGFSKSRKKSFKSIRKTKKRQLNYLRRNLKHIDDVIAKHPDEWENALSKWQRERLAVIRKLYAQQREMYENNSTRIDNRIVSLSQPWVHPIVRGKQNAPVEFGAKVEMSDINGFLRIEYLSWDAFNECKTLEESVESYRKAYGYYPQRVLADTIFRTRDNRRYCKDHGIHLNGPKLGKPAKDPEIRKQELQLEWEESGERGDIERRFGISKRCYSLGRITAKLKQTSEIMIHMSVLTLNLQKRLRLLLSCFLTWFKQFASA